MKNILLVIPCLLICAPLMAQPRERRAEPVPLPPVEGKLAGEEPRLLPRPLKIQFRFEPRDEREKPLWVLTTTERYGINVTFEGGGHAFRVKIGGLVRILDDNKVLLTYDVETGMKNPDGGGIIGAEGSVRVTPGKEKTLANLGDKSLVVVVTFEESEK